MGLYNSYVTESRVWPEVCGGCARVYLHPGLFNRHQWKSGTFHHAEPGERLGLWMGFSCSPNAPVITHLLFADDSLLFCSADTKCYSAFHSILATYEKGTGQLVNFEKSAFCCSRNISAEQAARISDALGILHTTEMESYLGMPVRTGRQKLRIFSNISHRVKKQLLSWRARMFSAGGREILVKAVVQAIPTFTMSLFKLPSTLINELHGLVARFWWGGVRKTSGKFIGRGGIFLPVQRKKGVWGLRTSATLIGLSLDVKCGE